jgi:hypothetical protein
VSRQAASVADLKLKSVGAPRTQVGADDGCRAVWMAGPGGLQRNRPEHSFGDLILGRLRHRGEDFRQWR